MAINELLTDRVEKLYGSAVLAKFCSDDWGQALRPLEEAEALCAAHPPSHDEGIPEIFSVLLNYRISLIHLRGIKNLGLPRLEEICGRLDRAKKFALFGPWPHLYQMVVLKKLKRKRDLLDTFHELTSLVSNHCREEGLIARGPLSDVDFPEIAQAHIFNSLELAAFFCELDYDELAGFSDSFTNASYGVNMAISAEAVQWQMVRFEDGLRATRTFPQPVAEKLAEEYFNDSKERGLKTLLLCIDLDGHIDQKRTKCTDESYIRRWTQDVNTHVLCAALFSAGSGETTERDHHKRLKTFFADSIRFDKSGAILTEDASLIIAVNAALVSHVCKPKVIVQS